MTTPDERQWTPDEHHCQDCVSSTVSIDEHTDHLILLTIRHDPSCPWLAVTTQGRGKMVLTSIIRHIPHERP